MSIEEDALSESTSPCSFRYKCIDDNEFASSPRCLRDSAAPAAPLRHSVAPQTVQLRFSSSYPLLAYRASASRKFLQQEDGCMRLSLLCQRNRFIFPPKISDSVVGK